jgi:hypothetical protein
MAGIERDWQIEFMRVQPPIFLGPEAVLGYPNYDEGWRRDGLERRCDVARSKCDWRADPIEAYADLFHPFPDDPLSRSSTTISSRAGARASDSRSSAEEPAGRRPRKRRLEPPPEPDAPDAAARFSSR